MILIVGDDFPGKAPEAPHGGGVFEILEDGSLMLTIQCPNMTPAESEALDAGYSHCGIYQDGKGVAILTWKHPAPIGYMETPFHAGIYQDDRITKYLSKAPRENNALTTVVLDGQKVVKLRMTGLMYPFVEELYRITLSQHLRPITIGEYRAALRELYHKFSPKDIYQRGRTWRQERE